MLIAKRGKVPHDWNEIVARPVCPIGKAADDHIPVKVDYHMSGVEDNQLNLVVVGHFVLALLSMVSSRELSYQPGNYGVIPWLPKQDLIISV